MLKLNPLTIKQINRFKSIKRGYISLLIFIILILLSLGAELFVNNRALMVKYNGEFYFPTYGDIITGKTFGLEYEYETDYRELSRVFENRNSGNYVILPVVPYNAFETDPFPGKPKILFIGLAESSHTHAWIDLLNGSALNVRLFSPTPSLLPPANWDIKTYSAQSPYGRQNPETRRI